MPDYSKDKNIVHFIQNILGCQCAPEVFNSIESGKGSTPNGEVAFTKMIVGNRLLIYIVRPMLESLILNLIPILTKMGISERNSKGYNRFRLVLPEQSEDEILHKLIDDFQKTAGNDEKAHIHLISINELSNLPEIV